MVSSYQLDGDTLTEYNVGDKTVTLTVDSVEHVDSRGTNINFEAVKIDGAVSSPIKIIKVNSNTHTAQFNDINSSTGGSAIYDCSSVTSGTMTITIKLDNAPSNNYRSNSIYQFTVGIKHVIPLVVNVIVGNVTSTPNVYSLKGDSTFDDPQAGVPLYQEYTITMVNASFPSGIPPQTSLNHTAINCIAPSL